MFGPAPGLTGDEAKNKETTDEKSKWVFFSNEPINIEKIWMIGAANEIAIEASFKLYHSTFKGKLY